MRKVVAYGQIMYLNEYDHYHREDGPAVETDKGSKYWYINGDQHRVLLPAVIMFNGAKEWFKYNKRHRLNAPAIISGDYKEYFEFGIKIK